MGYPLWDMLGDLAMARGGRGGDVDSDSRYLPGRLAAVTWIPGLGLALALGGLTGSWIVGLGVVILTLLAMVLIAFGPRQVMRRLRRPLEARR